MPKTDTDKTRNADKIDLIKLLGFEGISEELSESVDLQDEVVNAKLGAKVGFETMA